MKDQNQCQMAISVVFIALLFIGLIVLSGGDEVSSPVAGSIGILYKPFSSGKLEKASFSSNIRLLFIAGLEGTGHHAMYDMFSICNNTGNCEPDKIIGGACMRFDSSKNTMMGLFGSGATNEASRELTIIENRMKELKQIPGDHLFFIGLKSHTAGGMMSYPNFNGKNKALDNPDIYVLAQLAESVGLDFRVLVLQRGAEEIVHSATSRGFGGAEGKENEPKILLASANALYGQLSSLDRKFFECVRYDELGRLKPERVKELVEFLHPHNLQKDLPEMLKRVRYDKDISGENNDQNGRRVLSGRISPSHAVKPTTTKTTGSTAVGAATATVVNKTEWAAVKQQSVKYHTMLLAQRLALIDGLCT